MKVKVITLDNAEAGEAEIADAVFGVEVRRDILARMVNYQRAKRRAGTHKVKTRGEISGTTAKPFRQKGTGRARQGSIRATQFRGGATVFGPTPRDYAHDLPKKVRRLALKCALSAKQAEGKLVVLKEAKADSAKTRDLLKKLDALGWSNALIVGGTELDGNLTRAARNLRNIDVLPTQGANVYDILRCDTLVLTEDAVRGLEARLQ